MDNQRIRYTCWKCIVFIPKYREKSCRGDRHFCAKEYYVSVVENANDSICGTVNFLICTENHRIVTIKHGNDKYNRHSN